MKGRFLFAVVAALLVFGFAGNAEAQTTCQTCVYDDMPWRGEEGEGADGDCRFDSAGSLSSCWESPLYNDQGQWIGDACDGISGNGCPATSGGGGTGPGGGGGGGGGSCSTIGGACPVECFSCGGGGGGGYLF